MIYFTKPKKDVVIREANIANDVCMGSVNSAEGEGLLSVLHLYMQSCIYPPVRATKDWGQLLKEPSGLEDRSNFLGMLVIHIISSVH